MPRNTENAFGPNPSYSDPLLGDDDLGSGATGGRSLIEQPVTDEMTSLQPDSNALSKTAASVLFWIVLVIVATAVFFALRWAGLTDATWALVAVQLSLVAVLRFVIVRGRETTQR